MERRKRNLLVVLIGIVIVVAMVSSFGLGLFAPDTAKIVLPTPEVSQQPGGEPGEQSGLVLVDGDERTGRVMGVYVSDDHTPAMLPVFAYGPGADKFCGTYMNTEIARRIKSLIK